MFPLTCLQVINKVVHTILIQASDSSKMVTEKTSCFFLLWSPVDKTGFSFMLDGTDCGLKGRGKGKVLSSIVTSSD